MDFHKTSKLVEARNQAVIQVADASIKYLFRNQDLKDKRITADSGEDISLADFSKLIREKADKATKIEIGLPDAQYQYFLQQSVKVKFTFKDSSNTSSLKMNGLIELDLSNPEKKNIEHDKIFKDISQIKAITIHSISELANAWVDYKLKPKSKGEAKIDEVSNTMKLTVNGMPITLSNLFSFRKLDGWHLTDVYSLDFKNYEASVEQQHPDYVLADAQKAKTSSFSKF